MEKFEKDAQVSYMEHYAEPGSVALIMDENKNVALVLPGDPEDYLNRDVKDVPMHIRIIGTVASLIADPAFLRMLERLAKQREEVAK